MLNFIKAHIKALIVVLVVAVVLVAIPFAVEGVKTYQLDQTIKMNLDKLGKPEIIEQINNTEKTENVETNNKETKKEEPLTFRIKRITSTENNMEAIDYEIIPSYEKDYSKWTKQEKEAFQKAFEELEEMAEADHQALIENEEKAMEAAMQNLQ